MVERKTEGEEVPFQLFFGERWLRYGVFVLFIAAMLAGVGSFVALLAPYSSFGRMVQNLLSPLYLWGNNVLAYLAERADSYLFYEKELWLRSLPTFIIAAVSFVFVVILAWKGGRTLTENLWAR